MQARPWQWTADRTGSAPLWKKVRTLAYDYSEPIIRFAQIPGAFVPGLDTALEKLGGGLAALFGADLRISPLDGPNALQALDAAPPPLMDKAGDGPVFVDGVETTITVAHNGKGKEHITLERIDVCIMSFVPGSDSYFSTRRDGEAIIGAGFIEPMRFFVELEAKGPRPARRQMVGADGKKAMLSARGNNFLNTDPESFYDFAPDEPPQIVKITLTALDPGYYETCLRFFYRVAARELRQYTSEPIRLYTDGA